jgi:hypothetical protein
MHAQTIRGVTMATTSAGLTAAGAETVYDTANVLHFAIGGKAYSKAAVTDGTTPTADVDGNTLATLTANQGCVLLWLINKSGTVGVAQSAVIDLDESGNFKKVPDFPYYDEDTWCPFAYQVLKAGSTAGTITIGSSNWNATGFTNAIQNVIGMPARPQVS